MASTGMPCGHRASALVARCAPGDPGLAVPAFPVPALLGVWLALRQRTGLLEAHSRAQCFQVFGVTLRRCQCVIEKSPAAEGPMLAGFGAVVFHAISIQSDKVRARGPRVCTPARSAQSRR